MEIGYGYYQRLLYTEDNEVIGAIEFAANIETVYKQMRDINQIFITGTGIALFVTMIVGFLLAHAITQPIKDMRKQALALIERKLFSKGKSIWKR